jgi:hypothetical protein
MVKIKHLQQIHDLKSYRNACRVAKQLEPYTTQAFHNREKVFYLNKTGREMIGSYKEGKKGFAEHTLLRNEVYLYYQCPQTWENEYTIEYIEPSQSNPGFEIKGANYNLSNKKRMVSDAAFKRNGYLYLIEVDHEQKMLENKKKIEAYREFLKTWKNEPVIVSFFTKTPYRKGQLTQLLKGIRSEVKTFDEIK